MRSRMLTRLGMLATLFLLLQGAAECPSIPEMEDVQITMVADDYMELVFEARGSLNTHSDTFVIEVNELRDQIEDAGFEIEQLDSAHVSAVLYGVTAYNEEPTDREIENAYVEVTRHDIPETEILISNFNVAVYPLLGELVPAPLDESGIEFINGLLGDLLVALKDHTVSSYTVSGYVSGDSVPQGRYTDFDWRIRIYYQIIGRAEVERPDL